MKKLITATGKTFDCTWCGVSFLDQFFAATVGYSFDELLPVFQDPTETAALTFVDDGQKAVYTGYTQLTGLQLDPRTGYITVNLAPKGE